MSRQGDDSNNNPAGAGDPPAGTGGTGTGDPNPTPGGQTPPTGGDGGQQGGDDEARARVLEAARAGEKAALGREREARRALEAAEAELQKHRDAEKSELEKAQERAAQAERELETERKRAQRASIRFAVVEAARAEGFIDPEDAMHFINTDDVEFDDTGHPKGISDLVKELAKTKKHLLATAQPAAQPPNPSPSPNRDGKGATPDEMKQRREAAAAQTRQIF